MMPCPLAVPGCAYSPGGLERKPEGLLGSWKIGSGIEEQRYIPSSLIYELKFFLPCLSLLVHPAQIYQVSPSSFHSTYMVILLSVSLIVSITYSSINVCWYLL